MQRLSLFLVGTILISAAALAQRPHHVQETKNGKPVHDIDITLVGPGNLEGLYTESDDIVEVTVSASEARIIHEWARTIYTATVKRTYKGGLHTGDVISFTQHAGEVELPDEVRRTNGPPPLQGIGPFIVFLKRNEYLGGRTLVSDRSGAFLLREGRVEPQGSVRAVEGQRNMTAQEFSDELARLERHARPKA